MADFSSGNQMYVEVDSVPISEFVESCEPEHQRDVMEIKRGGGASIAHLVGAVADTYKLKGPFEPTVHSKFSAAMADPKPAPISFVFKIAGDTGPTETSLVYVANYKPKALAGKPNEWEAELVVNDAGVAYS